MEKTCFNCKNIALLAGKQRCMIYYKLLYEGKADICPRHDFKKDLYRRLYEKENKGRS